MDVLWWEILENIMRVILAILLALLLSACGKDSPQGGPPGGGMPPTMVETVKAEPGSTVRLYRTYVR